MIERETQQAHVASGGFPAEADKASNFAARATVSLRM